VGNVATWCSAGLRKPVVVVNRSLALACVFLLPGSVSAQQKETPICFGQPATIVGTDDFHETIRGTIGDDVITGGRGRDIIIGLAGNDRICGGPGQDSLRGNIGNDFLAGDQGDDSLTGHTGDDVLRGGREGNDTVVFPLDSRVAVDLLQGTASGQGRDRLLEIESIVGSPAGGRYRGSNERNFIDGSRGGPNFVLGRGGPDVLSGSASNDQLRGGRRRDRMSGGGGHDVLRGGPGSDLIGYGAARRGVIANLTTGRASGEGRDRLLRVERIFGSRFDDVLTGDEHANSLSGSQGADSLRGRGGNDRLDGNDGSDDLDGGPGSDSCVHGESTVRCE
jgi:Ca2+-binding RTX toxin-like protein